MNTLKGQRYLIYDVKKVKVLHAYGWFVCHMPFPYL
jgi:hypothetical protein